MDMSKLFDLILAFLTGGGITALVTWVASKRKNDNDIVQTNIGTAIKLRNEAMNEYKSVKSKLDEARKLLDEAQENLDLAHEYISLLHEILTNHNIKYPTFEEYNESKTKGETLNG